MTSCYLYTSLARVHMQYAVQFSPHTCEEIHTNRNGFVVDQRKKTITKRYFLNGLKNWNWYHLNGISPSPLKSLQMPTWFYYSASKRKLFGRDYNQMKWLLQFKNIRRISDLEWPPVNIPTMWGHSPSNPRPVLCKREATETQAAA